MWQKTIHDSIAEFSIGTALIPHGLAASKARPFSFRSWNES